MTKLPRLLVFFVVLFFAFEINYSQNNRIIFLGPKCPKPFTFKTNPQIQQYISFYQGRGRESMKVETSNFGLYQKMIQRIFCEEGVPRNLARINQNQIRGDSLFPSSLWVFSPAIASKYGLRRNKYLDETRSFEKATRVAAQYLKYLRNKYGSWEMAVAAFKTSEKNVDKIIKKRKTKRFWKIYPYLPSYVRNLVPNLLAVILITENPQLYGFENFLVKSNIEYELLRVGPSLNFELLSQFADSTPDELKKLNPEIISNITPPEHYIIRVPIDKSKILAQRLHKYYLKQKEMQ